MSDITQRVLNQLISNFSVALIDLLYIMLPIIGSIKKNGQINTLTAESV